MSIIVKLSTSPLELVRYHLTEVSFQPIGELLSCVKDGSIVYPQFDKTVKVETTFELGIPKTEQVPDEFILSIGFKCTPKKGSSFPYRFSIGASGIFRISTQVPREQRTKLVAVNGASVLYSALREQVLSITSRFIQPIMLPTISFMALAQSVSTLEPTQKPIETSSEKIQKSPSVNSTKKSKKKTT